MKHFHFFFFFMKLKREVCCRFQSKKRINSGWFSHWNTMSSRSVFSTLGTVLKRSKMRSKCPKARRRRDKNGYFGGILGKNSPPCFATIGNKGGIFTRNTTDTNKTHFLLKISRLKMLSQNVTIQNPDLSSAQNFEIRGGSHSQRGITEFFS